MQVRDVMTRDVHLVGPETSIREAAMRMRECHAGFLPVSAADRLVGTITDRDIVVRSTAEGQNPNTARVAEAMSAGVVYCFEDQDVRDVARLMGEKQIRRIVVLNRDKRLVGVASLGDLANRCGDTRLVGEAIEHISEHRAEPRNLEFGRKWSGSTLPAPSHRQGMLQPASQGVTRWMGALGRGTGNGPDALARVERSIESHPFAGLLAAIGLGMLIGGLLGAQWRSEATMRR